MKRYGPDPRCLSNAPTLMEFCRRLSAVVHNCKGVLSENGKIAILMGNYSDHGTFMPLTYHTAYLCTMEGLWPACTEIIRSPSEGAAPLRCIALRGAKPRSS